jgi:hypothetical protein
LLLPFSVGWHTMPRYALDNTCIVLPTGSTNTDTHKKTVLSSSGDPAHVSMPGVHRVSSLLKRWILGTHQGSIVPAHLQSYLEEFSFRFNRRTSRSRGLLFRRLLEQAAITGPIIETDITHGYKWSRFQQIEARRS